MNSSDASSDKCITNYLPLLRRRRLRKKKKTSNSRSGNVTDLPKHPLKQSRVSFRINGSYTLLNRTVEAFELDFKGVLFYLEPLLFVKDPILRPFSDLCFYAWTPAELPHTINSSNNCIALHKAAYLAHCLLPVAKERLVLASC